MSQEPSTAFAIQWNNYVDERWLSGVTEEILEPDLLIVDPHHHLWQWLGYMVPELLVDLGAGHNVRTTVFLETGAWYRQDGPEHLRPVGETEFVAAIAEQFAHDRNRARICQGIIGHADLMLGEAVDEVLQAHIAAGKGHFRGIRTNAQFDEVVNWMPASPPRHLLLEKQFRAGFSRLAAHGLVCDAMQFQTQIPSSPTSPARFRTPR